LIAALLVVLGAGGYYAYRRGLLNNIMSLHGVESHKHGMDLEPAVDSMLSQGYHPSDISAQLSGAGWEDTEIKSALTAAHQDQEDLGILAEKMQVDVPTTERKKAESYVKTCIKQGYTPTEIRTALKSAGWPSDTVDEAIDKASATHVKAHAAKSGAAKPSEDLDKLKSYVEKETKEGHTPQQIKKVLKDAGWSDSAIRQVLKM
jgi:SOS response regulatory protein OraA/RecX